MPKTSKEHYDRVVTHVWDGERQDDDPIWVDTAVDNKKHVVAGYLQNGKTKEVIARYDLRQEPPYYEFHIDYHSV